MDSASSAVLWCLFNDQGEHSRAVILPGGPPHTIAFFIDNVMDRLENYDTMDLALFRASDVKQSLMADGWREDR